MNKKYIIPIFILLSTVFACNFYLKKTSDAELINIVTKALNALHYSPVDVDDQFSKNVSDKFIESVDYSKRYFIAEDIKEFSKIEKQIDDDIENETIKYFNTVYNRLLKRIEESKSYYTEVLNQPFDFKIEEEYNSDFENNKFSKNQKALKKHWRKFLKANVLSDIYAELEKQKKEGFKGEKKTFEQIEKDKREESLKNLNRYYERLAKRKKKFWLAMYINTITAEFDPHTGYFSPKDKESFDIMISGSLEGIGATLSDNNGKPKIESIVVGSPSWKQGDLEVGDQIVAVAQEGKEAVNVEGWLLDDSIRLIRGKKGTKVTLTVEKQDGSKQQITIVRDVIEIDESYAKSAIIINKNKEKQGVIKLPSFYVNINDRSGREAASDVEKEILKLKKENITGIILDLRSNGGGSLQSAIDLVGLFIKKGPVVQVKSKGRARQVLKDTNSKVVWDGPLVVLVNELSASASEIVSAALQDYNRAVIIGASKTFGKGSVQSFISLDRFIKSDNPLGDLKLTIQKYYRINGGSVQLKGVSPDIQLPDRYMYFEIGEDDEYNPLEWDKIERSDYKPLSSNFDLVISESKERIKNNVNLKLIEEQAHWIDKLKKKHLVSLNFENYKKDIQEKEKFAEKFEILDSLKNVNIIQILKSDELSFKGDTIKETKSKKWVEALEKDLYLNESSAVLNQLAH